MKIILALILLSFCSCKNVNTADHRTFIKEYENSKLFHSMYQYKYLGEKDGYVYLKKMSRSSLQKDLWEDQIFIGKLKILPITIQKELLNKNKKYHMQP